MREGKGSRCWGVISNSGKAIELNIANLYKDTRLGRKPY